MYSIALVNQKGGVGKSTTAVNLAAGLARLGKRVLVIDLDPQAHATLAFGLKPRELTSSVYSLLCGTHRARDVVLPAGDNLWILPSTIDLAGGEAELAARPNSHFILREAMRDLGASEFDYAIVDSPPQLGFLNVNSLAWVREVYIPVQCEFYALHGLALLMNTIDRVRAQFNPDLQISAVIPCQVNPRRALTRDVLAELEKHFPGRVLKSRIRINVRLAEAPGHGKTIFDYAPESNGAIDYAALAAEVAESAHPEAIVEAAAPNPPPVFEAPPEPMAVAFAQVEARAPEPEPEPEPAPQPVKVEVAAPQPAVTVAEPGSFAHKLAMAGLKPIVVARKKVGEEEKKEGLTKKLLTKLFGKQD